MSFHPLLSSFSRRIHIKFCDWLFHLYPELLKVHQRLAFPVPYTRQSLALPTQTNTTFSTNKPKYIHLQTILYIHYTHNYTVYRATKFLNVYSLQVPTHLCLEFVQLATVAFNLHSSRYHFDRIRANENREKKGKRVVSDGTLFMPLTCLACDWFRWVLDGTFNFGQIKVDLCPNFMFS